MKSIKTMNFFVLVLLAILALVIGCGEETNYSITSSKQELSLNISDEVKLPIEYTEGANIIVSVDEVYLSYSNGTIKALKSGSTKVVVSLKEDETKKVEINVIIKENHSHEYNKEVVDAKYLAEEATCTSKAKYYYSCECGEKGTETFESGEVLAHTFDQKVVDDKYLASTATKDSPAKYYYSCKCGEKGTETFTDGEALKEYTISYELDGGTCEELVNTFLENEKVTLPLPIKEGYTFLGWFENEQKVEELTNKDYILVAKWEELTYTVSFTGDTSDLEKKELTFTYNEKVTLPILTKEGYVFLGWFENEQKVEELTNKDYTLVAKWEEIKLSIEIDTLDGKKEYYYDDEITIVAKILPESLNQEVTYKSLTRTRGDIYASGVVKIIKSGTLTFKVTSTEYDLSASLSITVLDCYNPYKLMEQFNIETVVAKKITAYDSTTGYKTYLLGGICNYLFQDIKVEQNIIKLGQNNRPGTSCNGNAFSAKYVTVHDVGAAGNALSNTTYCASGSADVSWHFTVGNDGIYQQLPLNEVGWHAGDGTGTPLVYTNTGIKAPDGSTDPATITINQTTGVFEVNGEQTTIVAPLSEYGTIVRNSELPYTGINNYVNADGYYMMGNTHWDKTYNTLGNYGGNLNSIGIETCVNKTSNIYLTWYYTAKLIATKILPQTGLLPRDVKQHNTFSGKDCPMTMRHANQWEGFMNIVKFEQQFYSYFQSEGWKLELICDSPYVKSNGMVSSLPESATKLEYKVRLYCEERSFDETFTYTTTLPAASEIKIQY